MKKNLSIIYDVTAHCPWNCDICCMGASSDKSCRKNELSLGEKLDLVRQTKELQGNGYNVKIDLSGGEIFTDKKSHLPLIEAFSKAVGKDKLGISCSGYAIDKETADFLGSYVSDVEMTMDVVPYRPYMLRPLGYSIAAAKAVALLKSAGCKVGIQTVVSSLNSGYADAFSVFGWCCANEVDNWSILRFFASGRGARFPEAVMSSSECERYVHMVQGIVSAYPGQNKPEVDFHYLMPGHSKHTCECRCVRKSIGILPNGNVVACFWALDSSTGAIDPKFLLGNVRENSLLEILGGERALYWTSRVHNCELAA